MVKEVSHNVSLCIYVRKVIPCLSP